MKRLFLLFILLPVISLGQTRQDAIVDSIKAAATSLHNIAAYINNHPDSKVEHINASDSGAYVTVTVRIHVPESVIIPTLLPQGVAAIRISPSIPDRPATVTVPTLPPPIIEADTILPLPVPVVAELMTGDTHILNLSAMEVPSLPDAAPEPEELPLPTLTECKIAAIVAWKTGTVTAPQQPDIKSDIIEPLLPSTAVSFSIEHPRISDKVYMTIVPVFEENRMPVDEMHLSDEGYSLLEKLEGFSSELYSLKDGGFTIGFGFFVPFEEGKKWSKGVTWERAEVIIRQKVPAYEDQVKQYINVPLTQVEFDAMTMLAYNLGGFSKATSIVNDINNNADFEQLQHDWMRFVHSKAPAVMKGLMNRRRDEMHVRGDADYQTERKIQMLKSGK